VDKRISSFVEVAREYCAFIEHGSADNSWVYAKECLALLLRLCERALLLPESWSDAVELPKGIQHEAWQEQFNRLRETFARDLYWEVFEPFESEKPEPLYGSISDDLADIWRDLKTGLLEIEKGTSSSVENAGWHWRFRFESHWGAHAAGAITALIALCFGPFADVTRPQDSAGGYRKVERRGPVLGRQFPISPPIVRLPPPSFPK
jgi:hypothetical protein